MTSPPAWIDSFVLFAPACAESPQQPSKSLATYRYPNMKNTPAAPSALPLKGVRVVEFCQIAAGPFCGMLLADFGAEVVKVEPQDGDGLRQWPPLKDGYSENFASLNRNKRSVALNLKDSAQRDFARALVLEADVVVENSRPGVMSRLGLGWESFREIKPSLVYCSISAYGQSGPRSSGGGFDLTMQAAAGVMSVTGEPGGAPVKCGVPLADFTAGLYAAFSIVSILARARANGSGGHVDVPMFATTLAIGALQTSEYFGTEKSPGPLGSAHPRNAPYQAFKARDGWFAVAAGNDRLWRAVCEVVNLPELMEDPRFQTTSSRARNQVSLKDLLEARLASATAHEWLARFEKAGVPNAPINNYEQALADPQAVHLRLVRTMQLPDGTLTRTVACPVWIDGAPVEIETRPPLLGEHAQVVRREIAARQGLQANESTL